MDPATQISDATLVERTLALYADGGSVGQALKKTKMRRANFWAYLRANPTARVRFDELQRDKAEQMLDEAYERGTDDEADPRRARVQVDSLVKLAGKYDPARFGDRIDVNHKQTIDISAALQEARQRALLPGRDLTPLPPAQIIDVASEPVERATDAPSVDAADRPAGAAPGSIFD